MRLHFYQQFFTGPAAPGTLQPRNLMRLLAERGHEVHVVAADFNVYNEQAEPEENTQFEGGGCLSVHRVRSRRGLRRSLRARLATYLGYALAARPPEGKRLGDGHLFFDVAVEAVSMTLS